MDKIKVIFVCLGNICRSPIAEAVFQKLIDDKKLTSKFIIDSAGTSGYHDGELADPRTRKIAERNGIDISHLSRKFSRADLINFDYILAMDKTNVSDLKQMAANSEQSYKIMLFRKFEDHKLNLEVPDPYYGDINSFIEVQNIVTRASNSFLTFLMNKHVGLREN